MHRNNHYLDALALACVAGHGVGQRIGEVAQISATTAQARPTTPSLPSDWTYGYRQKW